MGYMNTTLNRAQNRIVRGSAGMGWTDSGQAASGGQELYTMDPGDSTNGWVDAGQTDFLGNELYYAMTPTAVTSYTPPPLPTITTPVISGSGNVSATPAADVGQGVVAGISSFFKAFNTVETSTLNSQLIAAGRAPVSPTQVATGGLMGSVSGSSALLLLCGLGLILALSR